MRLDLQRYAIDLGNTGWDKFYGYGFVKYTTTPKSIIPDRKIIDSLYKPVDINEEASIEQQIEQLFMEFEISPSINLYNELLVLLEQFPNSLQKTIYQNRLQALINSYNNTAFQALKTYQKESTIENYQILEKALSIVVNENAKQQIEKNLVLHMPL